MRRLFIALVLSLMFAAPASAIRFDGSGMEETGCFNVRKTPKAYQYSLINTSRFGPILGIYLYNCRTGRISRSLLYKYSNVPYKTYAGKFYVRSRGNFYIKVISNGDWTIRG